jgi:hypothetical protein
MQVAGDVSQLEAVGGCQRQDNGVFGRRRLQLEIKCATKPFAQREAPGAIQATAERRVDDQLHAARFVEKRSKIRVSWVGRAPSAVRAAAR